MHMITDYTTIKTDYVKQRLKETSWSERQYIEDLMQIENFVDGEAGGMDALYMGNSLKTHYPEEWRAIWMELKPELYKALLEAEKKDTQSSLQRRKGKGTEADTKSKESWKKMGGK